MVKHVQNSFLMIAAFTLICGVAYPLLVTGIAAVIAPYQRNGSMIVRNGQEVGSAFIGQSLTSERYFHGRPSAVGYQPLPSGGSNRTVASIGFRADIQKLRDSLAILNGVKGASIPSDLVMASASGIDPHISPQAAHVQASRILNARGYASHRAQDIDRIITESTQDPFLGIFGQARVNVLQLNLALDAALP